MSRSVETALQRTMGSLEAQVTEIRADMRELGGRGRADGLESLIAEGRTIIDQLSTVFPSFQGAIDELDVERIRRGQYKRHIQFVHDVRRPARTPNILDTVILLFVFIIAEAALVVPTYVESGHADWLTAIGFSLAFAFAVNGAGLIAGFLFLRYAFVRLRSPAMSEPFDWLKRLGAQTGFLACIAGIGLAAFASLRTQALGPDAMNIWDFGVLDFAGTFAGPKSIITLLIALTGAVIAVYKGFTGFSDPVPHLSEATRYADDDLTDTFDDLAASYDDDIADLADDFVERAEDGLVDAEDDARDLTRDAHDLHDRINAFNARVDHRIQAIHNLNARSAGMNARIRGSGDSVRPDIDVSCLNALRIPAFDAERYAPDPEFGECARELRDVIARVRAAASEARARMRAARAEFLTASIDLDITSELKG